MTTPKFNLLQQIGQATQRMQQGETTLADYQLVLKYPALTSMFLKNQTPSKLYKKEQ